VKQVQPAGDVFEVVAQGAQERFNVVISTVSPRRMAEMVPVLPEPYRGKLTSLRSLGAVVMTVALDRPLTEGLYWINLPKQEGLPFLALVEHTNYIEPSHYGGQHLVYLGDYLPPEHRYFQMSQDELVDLFLPALERFNPAFDRSWVQGVWLHRAAYAQPIVPVRYSERIPPIATPIPGLYFASMSQVYPWDRGINYAVRLGRDVARMIDEDIRMGRVRDIDAWRTAPRPPVGMAP
jgi:protoporphyrinogen oxidase